MDTEITAPQQQSLVTLPYRWLCAHFAAYRKLAWWPFLWRITLEGLVVSIAAAMFTDAFLSTEDNSNIFGTALKAFIWMVLVGPILETLLLQNLPVMMARLCKGDFTIQLLAAWVPFAALHFTNSNSIGSGIAAGIIGGFYTAFTYVHWRQRTLKEAFWITTASHTLHNLIAFMGMYFSGEPF